VFYVLDLARQFTPLSRNVQVVPLYALMRRSFGCPLALGRLRPEVLRFAFHETHPPMSPNVQIHKLVAFQKGPHEISKGTSRDGKGPVPGLRSWRPRRRPACAVGEVATVHQAVDDRPRDGARNLLLLNAVESAMAETGDFASVSVRSITRTSLDRPFANHTSWRGAVGRHPKLLSSTRPGRQFNNG
jgi:hypothetical protein